MGELPWLTLNKEEENFFSACDYMDSPQSKLSAVGLVFFFNLYPVGNLFTGQRPKYCIPPERTLVKLNAEAARKKPQFTHRISKYQTSKKPKFHLFIIQI